MLVKQCCQRQPLTSGRGIRLIVGFQPLMVISPTASWIRWCRQVYACELMWTCLVWSERSTPDSFWVRSHWFNSATGEKKGITQTIYTDPEPPSRLPNSLMSNAKLRSGNLPAFTSLVWRGRGSNPRPPAPRADALTIMLRGGGAVDRWGNRTCLRQRQARKRRRVL